MNIKISTKEKIRMTQDINELVRKAFAKDKKSFCDIYKIAEEITWYDWMQDFLEELYWDDEEMLEIIKDDYYELSDYDIRMLNEYIAENYVEEIAMSYYKKLSKINCN